MTSSSAQISGMTPLPSLPASGARVPIVKDGDATNYSYDLAAGLTAIGDSLVFDVFGATPGDYTTGIGSDSVAAWASLNTFLDASDRNVAASFIGNGPPIKFPGAQYYFTEGMQVKRTLRLTGSGAGPGSYNTILRFAANKPGIVTNRSNTLGDAEENPATTDGGTTIVENMKLLSDGGSPVGTIATDLLSSGLRARARLFGRDISVQDFRGVGVCISASTGVAVSDPFYGNVNGTQLERVVVTGCKSGGVYISGGDANVVMLSGADVSTCGRYGIFASPFLSATLVNCQVNHCGYPSVSGVTEYSLVHRAGRRYQARYNVTTATLKATTPGTDETIWMDVGAGIASIDVPTWTGLDNYVPGGPYGGTGAGTVGVGCYFETGAGIPDMPNALFLGGFMGAGVGYTPQIFVADGNIRTNVSFAQAKAFIDASTAKAQLGGAFSTTAIPIIRWQSSAATSGFDPDRESGLTQEKATGDIYWDAYGTVTPMRWTGVSTARTYGGSAADAAYSVEINKLALGAANAARIFTGTSAVPASGVHGEGERAFNLAPTLTGVNAWICSAAGTSGTWFADYSYPRADPSTGIGYVTGAGGAVTQITSRTTTVPLNKVCGAITLFSAAGSATWATFTVTNTTVAATDIIKVNQKSGTDKYMIHVTNVQAGQFDITFATTGGTTVEQPVFNFSVTKAVAS
jgi:hypothetical protein